MPHCEYPHVVYRCSNSRRRLSCWLCTIKADCIFFLFFPPPPPRDVSPRNDSKGVFERRAQSRRSLSHFSSNHFPSRSRNCNSSGWKRFVANLPGPRLRSNQREERSSLIVLQNKAAPLLILDIRQFGECNMPAVQTYW